MDPERHGTVVVARHQTAGRGQHGRVWQSRPGASLLMSVILHPPEPLRRPVVLTAWAAVAVGDGANDLPMLLAAGTGVALHAKPRVQAECGVRVNHGDLTALLFIQGYAREDFVA